MLTVWCTGDEALRRCPIMERAAWASDTVTQNNGSRTEAYDACGTSAGITFVVAKAGAAVFVVGPVIVVILYYA